MRYAQGGGLTAEGRWRREQVRLRAVERSGWRDQRWTLARVRDLVAREFQVEYTVPEIWYLLRRRGWSCQMGARRAAGGVRDGHDRMS